MAKTQAAQAVLFEEEAEATVEPEPLWRTEWQGMPEFVQEAQRPAAQLIVRFETEADLHAFAALIGQRLTLKTKSIWHPHKSHWGGPASGKAWVSDEDA